MKYSIIIPIYNTEKFLPKCVESVLNQTFKDFEVILVDDGSPDICPQLCDEFAGKDSRVKVIHQKNKGRSIARNNGIEKAQGEYVIFMDSDDYWNDDNALQQLNDTQQADVIIFGCTDINIKTGEKTVSRNGYDLEFLNNNDVNDVICYLLSNRLFPGASYVFAAKREILINNNIRFIPGIIAEDYDFTFNVFTSCGSIYAVNNPFYTYRRFYRNSFNANVSSIEGPILTIDKWYNIAQNDKKLEKIKGDFLNYLAHIYSTTIVTMGRMSREDRKKAIEKVKPYKFILKYAKWKQTKSVKMFLDVFGFNISVLVISKIYRLIRG